MKVLVTGANGFIGRTVVERLLRDDGYTVRAALRQHQRVLPAHVEHTAGDLDPDRDWTDSLRGIDVVIHLAGRVHIARETSENALGEYRRVNVAGTVNLARSAAAAAVRRFIYVSSLKVNGESGRFTERSQPAPVGPYAQSKHEAEAALREIARDHRLDAVVIRPPLVYGPGVRANFRTLMRAVANGIPLPLATVRNRRSLIGVDNLADFIVTCLTHPDAANETFLVTDGEDLSTPDLVRRLARAMGRPARLFPFPPSLVRFGAFLCGGQNVAPLLDSLQADISKARLRLSWSPPFGIDDGLRRVAQSR